MFPCHPDRVWVPPLPCHPERSWFFAREEPAKSKDPAPHVHHCSIREFSPYSSTLVFRAKTSHDSPFALPPSPGTEAVLGRAEPARPYPGAGSLTLVSACPALQGTCVEPTRSPCPGVKRGRRTNALRESSNLLLRLRRIGTVNPRSWPASTIRA